ncbi:BRO-N domain-containing protein [Stutzerimonas nitrititolerans]|uniref:BRO-N domain-containing protein n=1 Tax=Stutzerimonas nitrititolerans TaxID=2482751 RepID=UPI00289BEE2D|nr:BRO family protein [Stutzerimonas nitrititolerans]
MDKFNTASGNVIPFSFGAQPVRALVQEDQPWFFAKDVCTALALADTNKALIGLDDDEKREHEQYSGSGRKPVLINESGLYSLILRSRKAEARAFKKWVTAEVLPAIRKHGHYSDDSGKMGTLVNDVIGMSGANLIGGVISQKVSVLPVGVQRQARHKLHAILHTRFNVPRTELIPADKLDTACQYVGSYALEGEWIEKPEMAGTVLTDSQLYDVYFICSHFKQLYDIFDRYRLYSHFSGIGSPVGAQMIDHFRDGYAGFHKLQALAPEFEAVQKRLGVNHYARTAA